MLNRRDILKIGGASGIVMLSDTIPVDVFADIRLSTSQYITAVQLGSGNTYYISATDGDDTRTAIQAKSKATPWRHHPFDANATSNADSVVLAAGDNVIMKLGDTWYDCQLTPNRSGNSSAQILTTIDGTWGSGSAVLSGAYDPAGFTWTDAGGGVFSASAATEPTIATFNGTKLTKNTTTPTTPSSGQYGWASSVLYVNVNGSASPSTGTILAAKRNYIIADGGNYLTFSGLTCEYANSTVDLGAVYQINRTGVIFDNLSVSWFNKSGILHFQGSAAIIQNCVVNGSSIADRGLRLASGVTSAILYGNTVYGFGDLKAGVYLENTSGAILCSNTVYNCIGYGVRIYGSSSNNLLLLNTFRDNNTAGVYYPSGTGIGVVIGINASDACSGNRLFANTFDGNRQHIYVQTGAGTGGNLIAFNIFKNSILNGVKIVGDPGVNHNKILNNTFIHSPSALNTSAYTGHAININSPKAIIANNIFYLLAPSPVSQAIALESGRADVRIDYNLYYNASGGNAAYGQINGTNYTTMADWKAALDADSYVFNLAGGTTGVEAHSVNSNPLFRSHPNNLKIKSSSPAKKAGVSVFANGDGDQYDADMILVWSDTSDSAIGPWLDGVDIGAFAYRGGWPLQFLFH